MSVETRVREAVRGYVDRLPVPPAPPLPQVPRRSPARRLTPLAAAVAAGLVLLAIVLIPGIGGEGELTPAEAPDGPPTLPDRIARYSYLTGHVSDSPPGRAIMVYDQGIGVELADFPQSLLLGADGDVYRRVDAAEWRGYQYMLGGSAPVLLSPDGSRIAIGTVRGARNVLLQDLTTGDVTTLDCPLLRDIKPLSWSSDGRYLVAIETERYNVRGRLVVFDISIPQCTRLGGFDDATMAAMSPDGTEVAVQLSGEILILGRADGRVRRTLATDQQVVIDDGAAWSPDGRWLAVHVMNGQQPTPQIRFIDVSGGGRERQPVDAGRGPMMGWTASDRIVIQDGLEILELDVETGARTRLTRLDEGPGDNYHHGDISFARNLLLGIQSRPAGPAKRGLWPLWLRLLIAGVLIIVGVLVTRGVRTFKRGTRTVKESGKTPVMSDTTDRSGTTGPTSERDHDVGR
jgi:hypothetical protein